MSEEEAEYEEEYVEDEEVIQPEAAEQPKPARKPPSRPPSVGRDRLETLSDLQSLTEAEKAMIAAKRRQEEDDVIKLQDYEERRRVEREREEEEIRLLKERQELRRVQREEEEREMQERRAELEERRRLEENERRARVEEDRRRKVEEKERKRQQMLNMTTGMGGRNFVLPEKKKDHSDKFGNIVQAKAEMSLTKEQREVAKNNFLSQIERQLGELGSLSGHDLRSKIKEMHSRICKLETEKYDLEKRVQIQEYDLKELNERQRQLNRNRNLKNNRGSDDTGGRHPPKIAVVSKYDRQIDRRNFGERRALYDKRNAFPCFPNVGPPPTILEFKVKPEGQAEDQAEEYEEVEEEEEEEE